MRPGITLGGIGLQDVFFETLQTNLQASLQAGLA